MKIKLELVSHDCPEDKRKFLNFWNYMNGEDVCCEVINDELHLTQFDENGNELPSRKISIGEFIKLVTERVKNWKT